MSRHHGKRHDRRHDRNRHHTPDRKPREEAKPEPADADSRRVLHDIKVAHLEQCEENSLKSGYGGAPVMVVPAGDGPISERMNEVIPFYGVFVTRSDAVSLAFKFAIPEGITKAIGSDTQVLLIEPEDYNHAQGELHNLLQILKDEVDAEPIF